VPLPPVWEASDAPDDSRRDPLIELLAGTEVGCPHCGYALRGVSQRRCPECGRAFGFADLLGRGERTAWAWLTVVVAWAACLPESYLMWQRLIVRGKPFWGGEGWVAREPETLWPWVIGWPEWLSMVASTGFWLAVPLTLAVVLLLRGRVVRLPRPARVGLAVVAGLGVVLAYRRWMWWLYASGLEKLLTPWDGQSGPMWPLWYLSH